MKFPALYQELLIRVFAAPNRLTCDILVASSQSDIEEVRSEAIQWIEAILIKEDIPLLIPYRDETHCVWFACCQEFGQTEQVREELTSFLGGVHATITRPGESLILSPVESIIRGQFESRYVKLTITPNQERGFLEALAIYRALLMRRPSRAVVGSRPEGRIRYDFEQALLANNEQNADRCIDEWKRTGRLSQQNLCFIVIRKLGALGNWSQIVHNPDHLRAIMDLKLPARIQSDLLEAIYHVHLIGYEIKGDFNGLKSAFDHKVRNQYGPLFKTRRGIRTKNVIMLFLLNELTHEKPDTAVCTDLLSEYDPDEIGYEYFHDLVNSLKQAEVKVDEKSLLSAASTAFDDGAYDKAFNLYLRCTLSKIVLVRILMCGDFIGSQESLHRAWQVCRGQTGFISELPTKWQQFHKHLKERFEGAVGQISDWYSWVEYVCGGGDPEQARKIAEKSVLEWNASGISSTPQKTRAFADLLITAWEADQSIMQEIFPALYEAFVTDPKREAKLLPVFSVLLFLLAYADSLSPDELELAKNLANTLLKYETQAEEYRKAVAFLSDIWKKKQSFHYLDWGLDVVELFVLYPAADFNATIPFFNGILQLAAQKKSFLSDGQWAILELLAVDYGLVDYVASIRPAKQAKEQDKSLSDLLNSKKIGIYTLEEPAGKRAKEVIEKLYPGAKVELNHDHEATPALTNLAKSADFFVFAWKSSKHQAFYCIQDNIKHKENLLLPAGKGTTSILICLNALI
jgi:hypothetical protein